jgi:putative IMPACT (imprinted ancient) family translation regulator
MTLRRLEEELYKYQEIEEKYEELEKIEKAIDAFDSDVLEKDFLEEKEDEILNYLEGYDDPEEVSKKIETLKQKIENKKRLMFLPFKEVVK